MKVARSAIEVSMFWCRRFLRPPRTPYQFFIAAVNFARLWCFATVDQVAADAYGATLIGQHRDNLAYLKMGHERGLGTMYWENLRVKEV